MRPLPATVARQQGRSNGHLPADRRRWGVAGPARAARVWNTARGLRVDLVQDTSLPEIVAAF